jgi:hypothetical protein
LALNLSSPRQTRLSRREFLALAALCSVCGLGWIARRFADRTFEATLNNSDDSDGVIPVPDTPEIAALRKLAAAIAPLFPKLAPPQSDDWLAK